MKKSHYKRPKKEGWYESKRYPHLDLPVPFEEAKQYVTDPIKVKAHSFYPFMSYEKKIRRYNKKGRSTKIRPIKYACHIDAHIYSYYAFEVSKSYENRISSLGLDDVVIGYRSGKGSNIELAKQSIEEIKRRRNCVAIAIDIKDFYGNIDHAGLKRGWCEVLDVKKLPEDHYSIFKSLTKWVAMDRDKLASALGYNLKNLPLRLVRSAKKFRELRIEDKMKSKKEKIFTKNTNTYGIPQGSSLSSLLSNIFMIPFDEKMNKLAQEINGFYRRYSDDILFVCDEEFKIQVLSEIDVGLREQGSTLQKNPSKDVISTFRIDIKTKKQTCDREFQYLGFIFNGRHIRIRSQTLSKYHRRLRFSVRNTKRHASSENKKNQGAKVYRKNLNKSHTHLGKEGFVGNYAKRSIEIMGGNRIKKQVKGSYERVTRELIEGTSVKATVSNI